ncbi:S8 family peptidase [Granulosicoccus sp. 3-233]|uniref:S8 family peptidase n=1 Tax=Granulosicoccus sp. 3-233 TaxID=3417969 RepID=UPI003D3450CE
MNLEEYVVIRSRHRIVPTLDNIRVRGAELMTDDPVQLEVEETALTASDIDDLRRDPSTRAIAPLMPMTLIQPVASEDDISTDHRVPLTWGVEATAASQSPFDGSGVTVAVLDTGIDPDHPAFQGVDLVHRNFTSEGPDDTNGHGTHCAGTVFGRSIDGLRIGVAPGVQRALIGKVLGEGGNSSGTIAQAMQWAVNEGAHVISMSLGIDFPGFVQYLTEEAGLDVRPATSMALEAYRANVNMFTELSSFIRAQGQFGQGCLVVAAAGNESRRPSYEIAVAPPAAGTGVVSVAALEERDGGFAVASFSNKQVDVAAPGVDVVSAIPGGGLGSKSGTSMATPHVAGIAALWAQRQLDSHAAVDGARLMARVVASGVTESLAAGTAIQDVGTGMVQAPLL